MIEYFFKPIRSLWNFIFKREGPTSEPTPNIEVNVSPQVTVQGNSGDTAALVDRLISLSAENANLKRDNEGLGQEKEALGRTIADLKNRRGPNAVDALQHLEAGDTEQAKQLYREIGETKASEGSSANKEAAEAYVNLGAIAFSIIRKRPSMPTQKPPDLTQTTPMLGMSLAACKPERETCALPKRATAMSSL